MLLGMHVKGRIVPVLKGVLHARAGVSAGCCMHVRGHTGNNAQGTCCMRAQVSPPAVTRDGPLQMLITNLDYDEHKGRIAIGRVTSGVIQKAEAITIARPGAPVVRCSTGMHPCSRSSLLQKALLSLIAAVVLMVCAC